MSYRRALPAFGKYTHMADANRLRTWLETGKITPAAAISYKQQKHAQQSQSQLSQR